MPSGDEGRVFVIAAIHYYCNRRDDNDRFPNDPPYRPAKERRFFERSNFGNDRLQQQDFDLCRCGFDFLCVKPDVPQGGVPVRYR